MTLDPRLHPYRRDLAARHLEGAVKSDRFVDGRRMQVGTSVVPVTGAPDPEGSLTSQMMLGEIFTVYDVDDATGLAWGQAERDGYVGWTPRFALEKPEEPTHRVKANFTHVYPEPELKCRAFDALPFLAEVAVTGQQVMNRLPIFGCRIAAQVVIPAVAGQHRKSLLKIRGRPVWTLTDVCQKHGPVEPPVGDIHQPHGIFSLPVPQGHTILVVRNKNLCA